MNCAVVIPCFNEAATIRGLVTAVRTGLPAVFVVDDGSTDATARQTADAGAQLIQHPSNAGKGAALQSGLQAAWAAGYGYAVTMDGDGQHRPEDIPRLLTCLEQTGAALVVGNRMHQPRAIPWVRRGANRWMSRLLSWRAGQALPDTQCGFRLVTLKAWSALAIRCRHFEVESEMLMAFLAAGHRVEFVPIQVVGRGPQSRIRPLIDAWRWCRWWLAGYFVGE